MKNNNLTQMQICKRDGRKVAFDAQKITFAIFKALRATGNPTGKLAEDLMLEVLQKLDIFEKLIMPQALKRCKTMLKRYCLPTNYSMRLKRISYTVNSMSISVMPKSCFRTSIWLKNTST
jgi:hypothetical protein